DGPGANLLSISGNHANRIFEIDSGSVTIGGLSIINGYADKGGGIFNAGNLTLDSVVVSHNSTSYAADGGGITSVNGSHTTITRSTICNNSAYTGAGILVVVGDLTVDNATIADNTLIGGSNLRINGSDITVTLGASAVLRNATLSGNQGSGISWNSSGGN